MINYQRAYNLLLRIFDIWVHIRPSQLELILKYKAYLSSKPVFAYSFQYNLVVKCKEMQGVGPKPVQFSNDIT